jgi:alpha-L-fucosidase
MPNRLYRSTAAVLLGLSVFTAKPAMTRAADAPTTKPAKAAKPVRHVTGKPGETAEQRDARMGWWRDARFGMFIHWGAYAVPASGEWYMTNAHIPIADYEKFAGELNPVKFDADKIASVAEEAGQKYLVITAKHHDGFCMFKTDTTKYNIVDASPWHQDPLKMLAAACEKHHVRFCCYYSIMDWHSPDQVGAKPDGPHPTYNPTSFPSPEHKAAYITYMKAQLKDLITQYHPGLIWFDGGWMNGWTTEDGKDLLAYLYNLDPDLIVNDRTNGGGDYGTPEQHIPANGLGYDWETCMTINNNWGYSAKDHHFKTTAVLLHNLIDIASKGGNYLLNVGPTAEGEIPQPEIDRLKEMGDWLKVNGDAIYGTTASPFKEQLTFGRCTKKGDTLYLSVFDWPTDGKLTIPLTTPVTRAYLLTDKTHELKTTASDGSVTIEVPDKAPDPIASVIAIETKP